MSDDFLSKSLVITDVETTGLDSCKHEIIEVGAVKVHPLTLEEIARIDIKVRPNHIENAEPEALAVNGYRPEDWTEAFSSEYAARFMASFLWDEILLAWNITFEFGFLDHMFERESVPQNPFRTHPHAIPRIDIPSIAWFILPRQQKWNMPAVLDFLKIEREPKPHRGINGALKELEILRAIRVLHDAR